MRHHLLCVIMTLFTVAPVLAQDVVVTHSNAQTYKFEDLGNAQTTSGDVYKKTGENQWEKIGTWDLPNPETNDDVDVYDNGGTHDATFNGLANSNNASGSVVDQNSGQGIPGGSWSVPTGN